MADIKISQLGAAVAVVDADVIPATANGVTVKVPASVLKEYAIGGTDISSIGDGTPTGAISALKSVKIEKTDIAPIETSVASKAYAVGDQLYYNGMLYSVIAAIAQGETLVVDTNIELSDKVTEQIKALQGFVDLVNADLQKEVTTRAALGAHNIFNLSAIGSGTQNQLIYRFNRDGSVTFDAATVTTFSLFPTEADHNKVGLLDSVKPSTKYVFSIGNIVSGMELEVYVKTTVSSSWNRLVLSTTATAEFTTPSTIYDIYARIGFNIGTAIPSEFTIYPMIRLASDADDSYRPYVPTNKDLLSYADNGILGAKNFWKNGNQSFTSVVYNLDVSNIPNGTYIFSADVTSTDTDATTCAIYDVTNAKLYQIGRGNNVSVEITLNNTQKLSLYASSYADISVEDTASFTNVMIRRVNDTNPTYQPYAMTNRELTEARVEAQTNKSGTLTVSSISTAEGNYAFTGGGYITIADVMTVGKKHLIKVAARQLYMTPTTLSGEEGGTIKLNNKTPLQNINEVLGTSFTSLNALNDTFKSAFRTYDNNKRCSMTMSMGANGHYLQVYMPDGNGMFHVPNYVWWAWCE